ncbi:uncharacterized protein I206_100369 [Kwoniella pini CBS 10737]|uniref:Uncharacterized protein n=1 Tax=Kwoniella pini CBS 10737 TaxID=1296096 RepID=A0A1B9IEE4_9TREE|nr:uncharacterized protein I206_00956 [Kwoniella pini CBS 10737]OCF53650.1 hypothetical protein I206_00956 [Kwoniella pini CBS 10737]
MPTWKTWPDTQAEERQEGTKQVVKGKGKGKGRTSKVNSTSSRKSKVSSTGKSSTSRQLEDDKTKQSIPKSNAEEENDAESESREGPRKGVFGMLDAILPAPKTSTARVAEGTLSFSKKPTPARKSRSCKKPKGKGKEKEKEPEVDDGAYNDIGIWIPNPLPSEELDNTAEIDELEEELQASLGALSTPKNKSKGKSSHNMLNSLSSPPPTKLITPALGREVMNPRVLDDTPLPFHPHQSYTPPKYINHLPILFHRTPKAKGLAHQDKQRTNAPRTIDEALPRPISLSISPETDDQGTRVSAQSPITRSKTRRSIQREEREEVARLSTTDEDDDESKIPPPSFLSRRYEAETAVREHLVLTREQA